MFQIGRADVGKIPRGKNVFEPGVGGLLGDDTSDQPDQLAKEVECQTQETRQHGASVDDGHPSLIKCLDDIAGILKGVFLYFL